MPETNFIKLKSEILSNDGETRIAASNGLARIRGKRTVNFLISLLKSPNRGARDAAALALRKLKDHNAAPHLIRASKKSTQAGTLVYALERLDCTKYFLDILKIALYGNYEMQSHALTILREQNFKTTRRELNKAQQLTKNFRKSETKNKDHEILLDEISRYLKKIEKRTN